MSQTAVILPGSPLSGSAMVGDINSAFASIISAFSGASAPTLGPGASSALVEGQLWLDTSVAPNVLRMWDGNFWVGFTLVDTTNHQVFQPNAWRNILSDNGGMEVWQRGAGSSASIAVGASTTAYTADRWYLTTGANEASVVAAVAGLTNQSNLAAKVTRNSGQTGTTAYIFGFPLDTDEVIRIRGQKVTLSSFVKSGANWSPTSGTLSVAFYVGTGAVGKRGGGFAGETTVLSGSVSLTVSTAAVLSAISAATVPLNATAGEVQFTWIPVGTAGGDDSISIDDVQLEVGTFASPFERTPFTKMLDGCFRHYTKTFPYGTAPAQNGGITGSLGFTAQVTTAATAFTQWNFPTEMRTTPTTVTTYNPTQTNANWRDQTGAGDVAVLVDTNSAKGSKGVFIGSQTTALTAAHNLYIHASADAGI